MTNTMNKYVVALTFVITRPARSWLYSADTIYDISQHIIEAPSEKVAEALAVVDRDSELCDEEKHGVTWELHQKHSILISSPDNNS